MENVSIIFASVQAEDVLDYLTDRIELLHYAGNELFIHNTATTTEIAAKGYATEILGRLPQATPLPVGPTIDLSALESDEIATLRDEFACMLKEVKEMFPLSDEEHVVTNELTYLTEEYADFAANSLTLLQTTNLSVCYYIYPYIQVDLANKQVVRNIPQTTPVAARGLTSGISFGSLAGKLAEAIAGKIGGGIGGLILNLLIPDDNTLKTDWAKINEAIENTVKRELVINNQNKALINLSSYLKDYNTEYAARKKSGQSSNDLFAYLERKDEMLKSEIVALFMYKVPEDYDMEAATFGNFILCSNVHLAHLQEKALLKPNNSEKAVISAWARQYTEYANAAMSRIVSKRMTFITDVEEFSYTHCTVGKNGDCYRRRGFMFTDNYPPKTEVKHEFGKKDEDEVRERTRSEQTRHKEQKSQSLKTDFNNTVNPILENWKVLFDNPIPFKEKEFRW